MPLEERLVPDVGDSLASALVAPFGPASGSYSHTERLGDGPFTTRDVDLYRFQAVAGSRLTARTSLPAGGTAVDTDLRLFDAGGSELAFNEDFDSVYSQFTFTFILPGSYYLGVSGYPNYNYNPNQEGSGVTGRTGDFRLDLSMVSPATALVPEIRGAEFNDVNRNGKRDGGEPGLPGITVYLDLNNNGQLDAAEPTSVSDANGNYAFTNLQPGNYTVAEVAPAGMVQTFPQSNLVPSANVNVSRRAGNQSEATIAVNPANPSQVFVASNDNDGLGLVAAYSTDGGATWTSRIIAAGTPSLPEFASDPQAAFDRFGNLFLTYISGSIQNNALVLKVLVALSTNGGQTFLSSATTVASVSSASGSLDIDQPSLATGPGDTASSGSVWVSFRFSGQISTAGARVTGLGSVGAFSFPQSVQGSTTTSNFGSIAIGPTGQVLVNYQRFFIDGTSTTHVNLDPDGLGPQGFGSRIDITSSNVGVPKRVPAQMTTHGIDPEANLAWDRSGGPHNGRVYLVYTDAFSVASEDTNIFLRYSDNNGTTWSAPVRVNDDTGLNSQFLPALAVDQTTGNVAVAWYDARHSSSNTATRFYVAVSTDSGVTFLPNVPVSAGISDAATSGETDLGYGDFFTLDFWNGRVRAVWADNSNSTGDSPNEQPGTSRFDIYTASVTVSASPGAVPHKVFLGAGQIVQDINFSNFVQSATTTAVVSSANATVFGQGVTFTATVAVVAPGTGTPTGAVTFRDGTTTLGTGTLNASGTVTFTTTTLALGTRAITAVYGGDANFSGSTSAILTQTVGQAATTTTVASSANLALVGQEVTFTATVAVVAPGRGTFAGTVTFRDGGTDLGTGTLNASGIATLTTTSLTLGTHVITAVYGGDANLSGSTSAGLTQTIIQGTTTTAVVVSSVNPSSVFQAVTFTATVAPVAPATGTPTGTVVFRIDGVAQPNVNLTNGQATLTLTLAVGTHTVSVTYNGEIPFNPSTSTPLTQTVNQAATATAVVSSLNPAVVGQGVTFTATVSALVSGAGTPTGTVTFRDGTTILGTGTLSGNGTATFTTSLLNVGSHAITAAYGGNANFSTSTSATLPQTVNQASSTTTLISSVNPSVINQSVTFAATVVPVAPATGTPTGTVTFRLDDVAQPNVNLTNGQATLTVANLSIGTHTVSATYNGDPSFTPSTSATLTQTVSQVISTSISGLAFHDVNGNSSKDTGETGLQGWTLFVDSNNNGSLDTGETSTTTGAGGAYTFINLPVGTYRVRELPQTGWVQTTSNPADIVLSTGSLIAGIHFGNYRPTVNSGTRLGTNFTGLDAANSGRNVPPDAQVAVGPSHVVEVVNSQIAIYNKGTGAQVFTQSLSSFFSTSAPTPLAPQVFYDDLANRFVVGALQEDDNTQTSFFNLAVSNASDPLAGFSEIQSIDVQQTSSSGQLLVASFPRLGWNADAYVVTFNMFTVAGTTLTFDHTQLLTIARSSVLDANANTLTTFQVNISGEPTLVPAVMHGSRTGDPMWFVQAASGGGNSVRVTRMTNVLSAAPTFANSVVSVPTYALPGDAFQSGGGVISTGDARILQAALRGNRLVAAHNVGAAGATHARWYEFNVAGTPTLTQSGEINPGLGVSTYYPSIDLATSGDLGMTYLQSSPSEFLSMYITGRTAADPLGTMETPVLAKGGQRAYSDFTGSLAFRVGGNSGISVDPTSGTTFWAAQEFATNGSSPNWGTWIAGFSLTPVPGMVSGQVFNDVNGNGSKDAGEGGLLGWTIFLDSNNNGLLEAEEASTTTDSNGNYSFVSVASGTYRVREVLQAGWVQTTANPADLVIGSGSTVTGVNFGNKTVPPPAGSRGPLGTDDGETPADLISLLDQPPRVLGAIAPSYGMAADPGQGMAVVQQGNLVPPAERASSLSALGDLDPQLVDGVFAGPSRPPEDEVLVRSWQSETLFDWDLAGLRFVPLPGGSRS